MTILKKQTTLILFFLFNIIDVNAAIDWKDSNQQQYIDNLLNCQLSIKEFEWNKSIWPEQNKKPKPQFNDVIDKESIRQQIIQYLNKRSLLLSKFGKNISAKDMQHDINRMVSNTKDSQGLKQLFQILDNNPTSIAQCISMPYLIENRLTKAFDWNEKLHLSLKKSAQQELDHFLASGKTDHMKPRNE